MNNLVKASFSDVIEVWKMIEIQNQIYKQQNLFIWYEDYPEYEDVLNDYHEGHLMVLKQGSLTVAGISQTTSLLEDQTGCQGVLYLTRLIVEPSLQKQGIGKLLMTFIQDWARSNQFYKIEFLVSQNNLPAISFYHHCGFLNGGYFKTPWESEKQKYFRFYKNLKSE